MTTARVATDQLTRALLDIAARGERPRCADRSRMSCGPPMIKTTVPSLPCGAQAAKSCAAWISPLRQM
jgi:hypothetical protein